MDYNHLHELYLEMEQMYKDVHAENQILKTELLKYINPMSLAKILVGEQDTEVIQSSEGAVSKIDHTSTEQDKLALFVDLFSGRTDVCAVRWESKSGKTGYSPYCRNEWKRGICDKPRISCRKCRNSDFVTFDISSVRKHLTGEVVLGAYAIDKDEYCRFLVIDLDGDKWKDDVKSLLECACEIKVPVYPEISRSGNGCHLWFFFTMPMKAGFARKFGMSFITKAMQKNLNIGFDTYDRLFPSQDYLVKDGFGNLIALPLQKALRSKGCTLFVNNDFQPYEDQWKLLASIQKIHREQMDSVIALTANRDTEYANTDNDKGLAKNDFPVGLSLRVGERIHIRKSGLSSKAVFYLRSLASYSNPEFFSKQAMRMSTFNTPRMTVVYEENHDEIILPRGILEIIVDVLESLEIDYLLRDERLRGEVIDIEFKGGLRPDQQKAFHEISSYDMGVLSAATGFGKTVLGARLIAEKKCSTLVLVHTKELALQWKERLDQFLDIKYEVPQPEQKGRGRRKVIPLIGQIGGGKNQVTGKIDVALMQSMFDKEKNVKDIIDNYGMVIVDECHHVTSSTFSKILSGTKARYIYGLSATPIRKDGHHPIIFMFCGPIRYKVDAKAEAAKRSFGHYVIPKFTSCRQPIFVNGDDWHISDVYSHICEDKARNRQIVHDVVSAVERGRSPIILTERTSHIDELVNLMKDTHLKVIELSGNLSAKDRKKALADIHELKDDESVVLIATGKLVGEGFDLPRLDTLFMAMPVAWKGKVAQYAGRLHREYKGKEEVLIYDYVDIHISLLDKMYQKRLTAYRSVGYKVANSMSELAISEGIYGDQDYLELFRNDLLSAKKHIMISSPFLQRKKISAIENTLLELYNRGIRVTLVIKPIEEYGESLRGAMVRLATGLYNHGFDVLMLPGNHFKFAVIDQSTVWYGGMNLLGTNRDSDSAVRINNEALNADLRGLIGEEDVVKYGSSN